MQVQAVPLAWVGVVGDLIRYLVDDLQTSTARHFLIVIVESTLQG
jgi:hypothetical protein